MVSRDSTVLAASIISNIAQRCVDPPHTPRILIVHSMHAVPPPSSFPRAIIYTRTSTYFERHELIGTAGFFLELRSSCTRREMRSLPNRVLARTVMEGF